MVLNRIYSGDILVLQTSDWLNLEVDGNIYNSTYFSLGIDELNNSTLPLEEALDDSTRIDYYYQHLSFVQQAIR